MKIFLRMYTNKLLKNVCEESFHTLKSVLQLAVLNKNILWKYKHT